MSQATEHAIAIIGGILFAVLFSLSMPSAHATVNTLSLVDEYTDGDTTVCIYSDGNRTESFVKEGAGSCPSKKTFH